MAGLSVTVFPLVVKLLLAGRKLATDPDWLNKAAALADLGAQAGKLDAAIGAAGLSDLARQMDARARELDRYLTHEGPAKDGARAIYQQVAPGVAAEPRHLTGAALDPAGAVDSMVAAILAGPMARDFRDQTYAEAYFRGIMAGMLEVVVRNSAVVDGISPPLWRRILAQHGIAGDALARPCATGSGP